MNNQSSFRIAIREFAEADAGAVAVISAQLGYPASSDQILRRFTQMAEHATLHGIYVAQVPETEAIVGWVHVYGVRLLESDGYAEIGGLVVLENFRRNGVGRKLIAECEKWAANNAYTNVCLRSGMQRQDEAHLFYQKIGYLPSKQSVMFRKEMKAELVN
jgi:GNAT superfamily N-acetyltransferase